MAEERKVYVSQLAPGMYVSRLDRPWLESPFPFQGLLLENWEQVAEIQNACEYVYVEEPGEEPAGEAQSPGGVIASVHGRRRNRRLRSGPRPIQEQESAWRASQPVAQIQRLGPASRRAPPVTATLQKEMHTARPLIDETREVVFQQLHDARHGRSLDVPAAREYVGRLTKSILRNPDALTWLSALKQRDEYTYLHSLSVCILSVAFGRYLGLARETLLELGFGAFLHDIGKMRIPDSVLNKPGQLSAQEMEMMRRHPQLGVEIVDGSERIPTNSRDVIYSHHERLDGSGYTEGVQGERIHLLTQLVSICDTYDAIVSHRPYKGATSPLTATGVLYRSRGRLFDARLVHEFIGCIGVYPVGSLVELSTEEVGVVLAANEDRLRPKVLVVLDAERQRLKTPYEVDLTRMLQTPDGRPLQIQRSLEIGAYGLQPDLLLARIEQD